ncbi:hypothetical protein GOQ29_05705, partial [Clostridium sp. D2Q-14]|nr:hypothetical protein [Anaeromonas gelatinilytica]
SKIKKLEDINPLKNKTKHLTGIKLTAQKIASRAWISLEKVMFGDGKKVSLSTRWKNVNNNKVQRDLYSTFLIMNSKKNLKTTDRNKCFETFDSFLELHNKEIERIRKAEGSRIFSSFGIKKIS